MTDHHTQRDTTSKALVYRLLGFLSILWATAILLVHMPAQIYNGNTSDFTFSLATLLAQVAPALTAVLVALSLPLLLPWPRFRRAWAVGWFALAAVVWVSSSFLVLDIGPLDGRLTQLDVPFGFTLTSLAVLIAIATGCVLLARRFPGPATAAALILNVMLIGTTGAAVVAGKKEVPPQYDAMMKTFFRFSESRNALVIILDGFQSDFFEQIIEENPAFRDKLDGFQFFPDTVGPAPSTLLALPAIHSGKTYDEKRTVSSVYTENVEHGSFLVALAKEGFETSLLNPLKVCPDQTACTTEEIVLAGSRAAIQQEYLRLLDLSILRAVPVAAKRLVFNGGVWRVRNWASIGSGDNRAYGGRKLLQVLGDQAYVSGQRPVAKFIHLLIPHLPLLLDEDCQPLAKPAPPTRRAILTQARCAVEAVTRLVDDLKRLDVYDKTTIAILADHGIHLGELRGQKGTPIGVANPLLLFKPRDQRGRLRISDHPAHTGDSPAMICRDLKACPDFWAPLAAANRQRVYHHYHWHHELWLIDAIPGLKRFMITGPVRSLDSWSRFAHPSLQLDRPLAFTPGSATENCLDWGWSTVEPWGVWSVDEWASMSFRVDKLARRRPLRVAATVRSYLNAQHRSITVEVNANGTAVGQWQFDLDRSSGQRDILLMPDVWSDDGGVTIRFHIDKPAAPADFGQSSDSRDLGIGLESLVLHNM